MLLRFIVLAGIAYFIYRLTGGELPSLPKAKAKKKVTGSGGDPWAILGVTKDATKAEIKAAYQDKVRQYHPDRLDGLAPELRDMAEERTKELNDAYAKLKG